MNTNPVALVTGARRGIGRSIALQLARDGYDIVINDQALDNNAKETIADIQTLGRVALAVQADVGDAMAVESLFAQTSQHFGRLDVLINNAAISALEPFTELQEQNWERVLDVDLKGPYLCGQAAARQMITQGHGGVIVNISSIHRERVWPGHTVYAVAKAGLVRLTMNMAYELGPYGIRVNAIAPGYIDSRMPTPREPPIGQADYASYVSPRTPLRRLGLPEDIANVVSFFVSEKASFVTGQCLTVDGGVTLGNTPDESR